MYSMAIIIHNTVLYTWNLLRVDFTCFHHTHESTRKNGDCEVVDVN